MNYLPSGRHQDIASSSPAHASNGGDVSFVFLKGDRVPFAHAGRKYPSYVELCSESDGSIAMLNQNLLVKRLCNHQRYTGDHVVVVQVLQTTFLPGSSTHLARQHVRDTGPPIVVVENILEVSRGILPSLNRQTSRWPRDSPHPGRRGESQHETLVIDKSQWVTMWFPMLPETGRDALPA